MALQTFVQQLILRRSEMAERMTAVMPSLKRQQLPLMLQPWRSLRSLSNLLQQLHRRHYQRTSATCARRGRASWRQA